MDHILHHSLAEEKAKNSGKRLHNALPYTLGEMEPKKFVATVAQIKDSYQFEANTLGDVLAELLFDTLV